MHLPGEPWEEGLKPPTTPDSSEHEGSVSWVEME